MQKPNLLSLLALALLSSCATLTVPNATICSVKGLVAAGANCANTNNGETSELSFDEFLTFLEPQAATDTTPARAGAICESAADWNGQKTALEQACRLLGKRCTYELKTAIAHYNDATVKVLKHGP